MSDSGDAESKEQDVAVDDAGGDASESPAKGKKAVSCANTQTTTRDSASPRLDRPAVSFE